MGQIIDLHCLVISGIVKTDDECNCHSCRSSQSVSLPSPLLKLRTDSDRLLARSYRQTSRLGPSSDTMTKTTLYFQAD